MNYLTPGEFIPVYQKTAAAKLELSPLRRFILSVLAGIFLGICASMTNIAVFSLSSPGLSKLLSGLLFPFGLIMIILSSAELFTGDCLMTIPVTNRKLSFLSVFKHLILVYFGNFLGCLIAAAVYVYIMNINLAGGELAVFTIKTAAAKCSLGAYKVFILAIFWSAPRFYSLPAQKTASEGSQVRLFPFAYLLFADLSTASRICFTFPQVFSAKALRNFPRSHLITA